MNVVFTPKQARDKVDDFVSLMKENQKKALIFSRLESHREVIAVVPPSTHELTLRCWVWLSSSGSGAYLSGGARDLADIAQTLVFGEWVYQPEATMHLTGGLSE